MNHMLFNAFIWANSSKAKYNVSSNTFCVYIYIFCNSSEEIQGGCRLSIGTVSDSVWQKNIMACPTLFVQTASATYSKTEGHCFIRSAAFPGEIV